MPEDYDETSVLTLVLAETAAIAGLDSPGEIDPQAGFRDLGFDSLAAVELSTRLERLTGLELPVTLGFDHPTPAALAAYLHGLLGGPKDAQAAGGSGESGPIHDPIAIVGIGCRYPGGVRSPEDLFALVIEERDAVGRFPNDRGWALNDLFNADPSHPHTSYTREGGFMDDVDVFDAAFFGIGPNEATAMDPQQRLLLETTWEAFEHARIDPLELRGSRTGVFLGLATHDHYGSRARCVPPELEGYFGLGNAGSVASGRLAYLFGFEGPAYTVDTACSSSLASLHLACRALLSGECTMALAGGVTVLTTPETFVLFSRQQSLSPDGRCKAFGADADGTGFAEGVGLVLLERLSDAQQLGHRVLAIIRGSAVNQDGASNGLTAPRGPSQERVIREALADARLSPIDVDAVEAHGTGTKLGDPIEARALLATYGVDRSPDRPLWLGSLKSNIGHAQAAAGIGGVIKTVMAMSHCQLPKTLHVGAPTPHVDWSSGAIRLLTEATEWPSFGRPRRGAVSAFGISGTNAHMILEEAPADDRPPRRNGRASRPVIAPWVFSARSELALRDQVERLHDHVERLGHGPLDVAHSLIKTRASLEHRAVVLGGSIDELLERSRAVVSGSRTPGVVRGRARHPAPIAFVFPGQGSHWAGMCRELSASSPVFAERLGGVTAALTRHLGWPLEAVIRGEPGSPSLDRVDVVQPALFATMVSLAEAWRAFGVTPDVVIGHSQGEIAAAHVAGALSLDDAARLVVLRSRVLANIAGQGGMLSVALPAADLDARLAHWTGRLTVAATNGPASAVVSGDLQALKELLVECEQGDIWARLLPGDVPGHSPYVDALRAELVAEVQNVTGDVGQVGFISTVTGSPLDTSRLDAEYWFANIRRTVRFADAVQAAIERGCRTFLEVSPHPVLTAAIDTVIESVDVDPAQTTVVGSLRRDDGGLDRLAASAAELHVRGHDVDWTILFDEQSAQQVSLPTYAFERTRFWMREHPASSCGTPDSCYTALDHPLLKTQVVVAGRDECLFTGQLAIDEDRWLSDHVVMGTVLASGTVFVELALRAGKELGCDVVEELILEAPLVLDEGVIQLQVWTGPLTAEGRRALTVSAREAGGDGGHLWVQHASGTIASRVPEDVSADRAPWSPPADEPSIGAIYTQLLAKGLAYGPTYQSLRTVWSSDETVYAEVRLDADAQRTSGQFEIHPALLDAAFHGMDELLDVEPGYVWMPFSWTGVKVDSPGAHALRARVDRDGAELALRAEDESGACVVSIRSVVARKVSLTQLRSVARREGVYVVDWQAARASRTAMPETLVLGDISPAIDARRFVEASTLVQAIREGARTPDVVLTEPKPSANSGDLATDTLKVIGQLLELLQVWLGEEALHHSRLVCLTRGAVGTTSTEAVDPTAAAIWGLVRAARAEHPNTVLLVDLDEEPCGEATIAAALATGEPEMAIRKGRVLVPRLTRARANDQSSVRELDLNGTVIITGGTAGLGASIARHLVTSYGVRHLMLASRRGAAAPQASSLKTELTELGAEVAITACDVASRSAVRDLIADVPAEHPLTAVVHSAGVLDDAVVSSLTSEQLERVLQPKVNGAVHLHELTTELDISAFVSFSSIAGTIGGAGQANYSAANAFLDGLAQCRHAQGLPATSIAWGLWAETTEMDSHLEDDHHRRLARLGLTPLNTDYALERFDEALALARPLVLIPGFDMPVLHKLATIDELPPILASLVGRRAIARQPGDGGLLAQRLATADEASRSPIIVDLVCEHAAAVLGYPSPSAVDVRRTFKEQGFESLGALELRSRLSDATGLWLPASLVFNHPTPSMLADHLLALVSAREPSLSAVDEQLDRVEALLAAGVAGDERERAIGRLRKLLAAIDSTHVVAPSSGGRSLTARLANASADEIFELVDRDLVP